MVPTVPALQHISLWYAGLRRSVSWARRRRTVPALQTKQARTSGQYLSPRRLVKICLFVPDVYPGSDFFPSRIRTVSIPDPRQTPKKEKKRFLSSKKHDPGCSSQIPDPDTDFLPSRIPDPGVKKVPNPGSRIRIRNTGCHGSRNNHFLGIQPADDW